MSSNNGGGTISNNKASDLRGINLQGAGAATTNSTAAAQ